MIELYKLMGNDAKVHEYQQRQKCSRQSLTQLVTDEGYFYSALDPDGTRHGVFGQTPYGYINTVPNVDAIALRITDDIQSQRIYKKIASIPSLRPYGYLITNYPSLDDTYENWGSGDLTGLWKYGQWVNGGAWLTQETRTLIAYSRVGAYEDIRQSMKKTMQYADKFQLDAPFTDFGNAVYFPDRLTNFCYDSLGVAAGAIRGLFEFRYLADTLELYPHIPPTITYYKQKTPIRWGSKSIAQLIVYNCGTAIAGVNVNGKAYDNYSTAAVFLVFSELPETARIEIIMTEARPVDPIPVSDVAADDELEVESMPMSEDMAPAYRKLCAMAESIKNAAFTAYEQAFLQETLAAYRAYRIRASRTAAGHYDHVAEDKRRQIVADYKSVAQAMTQGWDSIMKEYHLDNDTVKKTISSVWFNINTL